MFGIFKRQNKKDKYLLKIAEILHNYLKPGLPFDNAYCLAEECLKELRNNISKGMFYDGENPKENIMAYYSICSMLNEIISSDNKIEILKLSVMAKILRDELDSFDDMTSLEKGIWQFGEQLLEDTHNTQSKDDIEKIKSNAVEVIMDLMKEQHIVALIHDVKKIVDNVSFNAGNNEVSKVGSKILALSVLFNATGYYIDQKDNDLAFSYFMCIDAALNKYIYKNIDSYNEYQKEALNMITKDFESLAKEVFPF